MQHLIIKEIESLLQHCYNRSNLITCLSENDEFELRKLNVKLLNLKIEFEHFGDKLHCDKLSMNNLLNKILEGADRMKVDLKSTLDIDDRTFDEISSYKST